MYTPHTVTLYNVIQETDMSTFEEVEHTYITVLHNVFLDAVKSANVNRSGLEGADAVALFIPLDVTATDGITGETKQYAGPQEFWAASDRTGLWTLSVEGNGGETFFVKGVVVDNVNVARAHDDSYNVTKVDLKDFGSANMRHWEIGGA